MENIQNWETAKLHGRIVARAWSDKSFKDQLLANPAVVLRESGFDVPAGFEVRIEGADAVVRSGNVIHFGLPAQPNDDSGIETLSLAGGRIQGVNSTQSVQCTNTTNTADCHTTNCTGPFCDCIECAVAPPEPDIVKQ